MGMALFTILGALSQLERELIRERVRAGLAAAKQKGKLIGRKKLRDSDLIRKLLKSGLSFRQVSSIAKCSHGSVSAEKQAMKREEEELRKKMEAENPKAPSVSSPPTEPEQPDPPPTHTHLRLV
jgi:DNA invertase Pin-like site-specific DNA recombinase